MKKQFHDDILRETWRIKDALAAKYHYNVDSMFRSMRSREGRLGHRLVDLSKRRAPRTTAGTSIK